MRVLRGTGYLHFAFDVGQGIALYDAARLLTLPTEPTRIRHRHPAPRYFQFEAPPLRVRVDAPELDVAGLRTSAGAEGVLFDFGAVSVRYAVPLAGPLEDLVGVTAALEDEAGALAEDARRRASELFEAIRDAIEAPLLAPLIEDYAVFHVAALEGRDAPSALLEGERQVLARILRGEPGELAEDEEEDALAARIAYGPGDLVLLDWTAALVFGEEVEDVCAVLEYVNTQLLEMRLLDGQLDRALDRCYEVMGGRRFPAPFVRLDVRRIGEMQVDGALLHERVRNALKLLGDQYLARLYRLAASRFHLAEWHASIQRKLEALESVYGKLFDRASALRLEILEWLIVLLIAFEVVWSLLGR